MPDAADMLASLRSSHGLPPPLRAAGRQMLYSTAREPDRVYPRPDLSPREVAILERRFDLDGRGSRTLGTIGTELGISKERVRQLQTVALRKLRRMSVPEYEAETSTEAAGPG